MALPLNKRLIIVLIILLGFTAPLSTDMCLPALSTIADDLNAANSVTKLIIISFFFFMALSTLLAGPMSDRFGRKKVMIASISIYTICNVACMLSTHIAFLIAARALSACGAGGMLNASTALTKDVFSGRERDTTLSIVQVFQIVAPLLAPVIGAALLTYLSWHASFGVLAGIGAIEILLAAIQPETQPEDERGASKISETFKSLGIILRNRSFTLMMICVGALQACFMAYLATSSYIYQINFHVSAQIYSLFFSASALVTLAAPAVYMKCLYDRMKHANIYRLAQAGVLIGGILIIIVGISYGAGALEQFGMLGPVLFWASFLIVAFCNSIARPLGVSTLLKQHQRDTGSLSALINFGLYIIGLIGMILGSFDWNNYMLALGCIIVSIVIIAIVVFSIVVRPSNGLIWEENDQ